MKKEYMEMVERIDAIPRTEYPELVWALERGEWDDRLGSKPENWEDLDQFGRSTAASKHIDYLKSKVSRKELERYFLTHYLDYTEQQFEDSWDSAIMCYLEHFALQNRENPLKNTEEMLGQQTGNKRKKLLEQCKKYLKYTVSAAFGLTVSLGCRNLLAGLLILFLFFAYILLSD